MGSRGAGHLEPVPAAATPGRATFLELFFDLVYVFALTRISARAFEDLTESPAREHGWAAVTGSGKTLLLLLALWSVWQGTAWTTSRYDPYKLALQTVVLTALVGSMVMGVAILRAFTETGLMFAVAYVVAQVSRQLILSMALGPHPYRRLKVRMTVVFASTGVLWIGGALLPTNTQVQLWTAALVIEYTAARCGWPVPGLGRSTISKWEIAGEHLAERYQQFFLVALGETILVAGFAYSKGPYESGHVWAFGLALATSIVLWRIYVQRAGQILAEAVMKARHPATIGRSAADTHLVMVVGLAATAVGVLVLGGVAVADARRAHGAPPEAAAPPF
ncbi:low temperature requirement protein A [Micromonospora sp. ALFpr18c]|uniref:low temperature requirement protein A n=1 Tax=Micromonospora sp. ALFpr18c TaxID=1458665 RepID=UPI00124B577B|nr:low temperature requirement protein A [Micromonospora sp. ALFpr18c]KAB1928092.1 low temperature requirement protein A [Micromonospora sp. ALFpr18c]